MREAGDELSSKSSVFLVCEQDKKAGGARDWLI